MSAESSTPLQTGWREGGDDPLSPVPPRPAHFDPALGAWVLSRHADVLAALRERGLRQESAHGSASANGDQGAGANVRGAVLTALPASRIEEWQRLIEPLARTMFDRLPVDRPVDLVHELIRPWTSAVATIVLKASPVQTRRLIRLAGYLPGGRAGLRTGRRTPLDVWFAVRRKFADAELERFFRKRAGAKSVFIGIAETLPGFLANAWLALLRHPSDLALLHAQSGAMPKAIEELLRYAGLVHSLVRHAAVNVDLGGVRIAAGDRAILKLASANRDPEQFPDPDRLDLARRAAGHLSLGTGPHACPGATFLRMAAAVATSVFVEQCAAAELVGPVEWRHGSTLVSPASLPVLIRR